MKAARQDWFEGQLDLDPDTLVFLDETAAHTNMARRYGWAPRGERCRAPVPCGHYKTTTVTAALRTTGLIATALLDGATNGERFRTYVTDILVPVLKPGDTVILDNLTAHKVAGVREAIERVGARLLYLPAYSPDFNPIEMAFAKLKALLRTAAARTVTDLWAAIRDAFRAFNLYAPVDTDPGAHGRFDARSRPSVAAADPRWLKLGIATVLGAVVGGAVLLARPWDRRS